MKNMYMVTHAKFPEWSYGLFETSYEARERARHLSEENEGEMYDIMIMPVSPYTARGNQPTKLESYFYGSVCY